MPSNYRTDCIAHKLSVARFRPLDVLVTGVTGAGKSTTLNSLFKKEVAKVGEGVDPETMELDSYSLHDHLRFWDSPGLGDGVQKDQEHSKSIIDLLYKTYHMDNMDYGWIDLVLVILDGSSRDMGTNYRLLNEVILPNIDSDRVLVAINQADMAQKGRNWCHDTHRPNKQLIEFLQEKSLSVMSRVQEATDLKIKKPVFYSAEYSFNIPALLDLVIDSIPSERRRMRLS